LISGGKVAKSIVVVPFKNVDLADVGADACRVGMPARADQRRAMQSRVNVSRSAGAALAATDWAGRKSESVNDAGDGHRTDSGDKGDHVGGRSWVIHACLIDFCVGASGCA
jgi:hypothetical protein